MTAHAAIYARISSDQQGRREGVKAQVQWGRAYAAEHWPDLPVEVFADNDVTAAKDDAHRPEFERLREWIQAGKVARLWVSWQSRLARKETVWFPLVDELYAAGITELHTRHEGVKGLHDIGTGIMATVDAHYVRELREKVKDKKNVLAAAGRPHGGHGFGYRNFVAEDHEARRAWWRSRWEAGQRGDDPDEWQRDHPLPPGRPLLDDAGRKMIEVVPDEAAALREAAERILNGWTLVRAADGMNRRGLYGAFGADWTFSSLRNRLMSPTLAGLRVQRGEIVGKATWEPILDETTWRPVTARLKGDRTFERPDGTVVRIPSTRPTKRHTYLLTGVVECAVCGAKVAGGRYRGVRQYRCAAIYGGRSCVAVPSDDLDVWVRDRMFDEWDKPEFIAAFGADWNAERRDEIVAELAAVEARRLEVADWWNNRKLTAAQFSSMNDALIVQEQQLNHELAELPAPPGTIVFDLADIRRKWHRMEFDEQRQVVVLCIERVTVDRWRAGRVAQRDVAEAAGVSQVTVSMVLGRNRSAPEVSDETRERIRKVAAEIGFDPAVSRRKVDDRRVTIEWRKNG